MNKASRVLLIFVLALCACHSAYAAGISDADLSALFPGGKVEKNVTLDVPGQGYFGAEIIVRIPYKEKISGADSDYETAPARPLPDSTAHSTPPPPAAAPIGLR